eukprot:352129-Chlamydomonas_euryale.AAC.10
MRARSHARVRRELGSCPERARPRSARTRAQVDGECNFTWGISTLAASTGRATGRRQHKPFVVSKPVDKASPLLVREQALGAARSNFVHSCFKFV